MLEWTMYRLVRQMTLVRRFGQDTAFLLEHAQNHMEDLSKGRSLNALPFDAGGHGGLGEHHL
jgi:hypothetical protein